MSIRFRLSFLVTLLFITAIANTVFMFWLEKLGEEKLAWVNHTHNVLYSTEQLLGYLKDAETGQRGYLLTEDTSYLEPYHTGTTRAEQEFKTLKVLTSDNPEQQQLLEEIHAQMLLKFEELEETIELAQAGNKEATLSVVTDNRGKIFMDNIRQQIAKFTSNELVLMERRKGDYREYRAGITTLVFVQGAVFIGLAVITFLFLRKSLFSPLKLLVANAEKIKRGQKLESSDIVEKDEMGNLLATFFDMGDKVYSREKALVHETEHDALTGLKNRTTVLDTIALAVSKAQETRNKAAILFIDLNKFKQLNDTHGHDFGDIVLKETAAKLTAVVRSTDSVFRLSGDEFLIVVKAAENTQSIEHVLKKIAVAFSLPVKIKDKNIHISLSIGVAVTPDDSVDAQTLIEYADVAMYESKRDPSITFKWFDTSMLKRAAEKNALRGNEPSDILLSWQRKN